MEKLLLMLAHWPDILIYGLAGGILGGIGFVIGLFAAALTGSERSRLIAVGLCVALALPLGHAISDKAQTTAVIHEIKKYRLGQVLFQYHPEAEARLKEKFREALKLSSPEARAQAAQKATSDIAAEYLQRHIMNAPEDPVYNMLLENREMLLALQGIPETCVAYFMGNGRMDSSFQHSGIRSLEFT